MGLLPNRHARGHGQPLIFNNRGTMIMNIKTFMAIAVVALTAACSEVPAVTTDEAANAVAADDNVEAAVEDAETPVAAPII
jgi:hypothetical protein